MSKRTRAAALGAAATALAAGLGAYPVFFHGVVVPVVDLSGLPAPEREAALRREVEAEATTPFDLGRGPLLRVRLVRLQNVRDALQPTRVEPAPASR